MTIERQNNRDRRPEAEQGDINTTTARQRYWDRNLSGEAKAWFEEDKRVFLHQSLSTPVMNVIVKAQGAWLEDMNGKRYLDMHGNGVHNAGFNHPEIVEAVKKAARRVFDLLPSALTRTSPLFSSQKNWRRSPPATSAAPFSVRGGRMRSRWR